MLEMYKEQILNGKPREGFNKKNIKSYGIFHTGGLGLGLADFHTFFRKKKCFFHKKYKDDQNGLIHPEK